jgi:hypothetical protein
MRSSAYQNIGMEDLCRCERRGPVCIVGRPIVLWKLFLVLIFIVTVVNAQVVSIIALNVDPATRVG